MDDSPTQPVSRPEENVSSSSSSSQMSEEEKWLDDSELDHISNSLLSLPDDDPLRWSGLQDEVTVVQQPKPKLKNPEINISPTVYDGATENESFYSCLKWYLYPIDT